MWNLIVKTALTLLAGMGITHFGDTYVKPVIAPTESTLSAVKGVSWTKIVFWVVSTVVAALLVKFIARKLNIKILK